MELKASPLGSTPIVASTRSAPTNSNASAEYESLRNRLNGELDIAVAGRMDMTIERCQRDTEMRGLALLNSGM